MGNDLINHIEKLHTTEMGVDRIKWNLQIEENDVVEYCKNIISGHAATIERIGKNWYIVADDCKITVNAHSYTIITAHKNRK